MADPIAAQSTALDHLRLKRVGAGESSSGIRLGLVVQGGGMRGVYSMAALAALEKTGLSRAFDYAVGSSSGALNAAYMIAGQARLAVSIYLEDIASTRFMDPLRPGRWGDFNVLVEGVLTRSRRALDLRTLRASKTELRIVLTACQTARPVVFSSRGDVDLMEVLRATATLPIVRGGPVRIDGAEYVDGALSDTIPLSQALELDCTDIMAVLTRPIGTRSQGLTGMARMVASFLSRHERPAMRDLISAPDDRFNAAMAFIENDDGRKRGVNVVVVAPSNHCRMVSSTTTNRRRLEDCAAMAWEDVGKILGEDLGKVPW